MNTRPRRLALLGLALGVLLALVVAPQTRWLIRLQALTSLNLYHPLPRQGMASDASGHYFTSEANDSQLTYRVTERHPNDYATQYAYAANKPEAQQVLAALRALALRFPNEPSLYANLLRHETRGNVTLYRAEAFMGGPVSADYKLLLQLPKPFPAVPLACLLIVGYGGVTLATVRQDNVIREEAERMVTGEGQYLAEKTGQPWPVSAR